MKLLLVLLALTVTGGCNTEQNDNDDALSDAGPGAPDMSTSDATRDIASRPDLRTGNDIGGGDSGGADLSMPVLIVESEPNDGATLEEFDDLPIEAQISGNIGVSDADVFFVDTAPGTLYRASLVLTPGSELQPHIAVFDTGRGQDPAGGDYVKIVRDGEIAFLAMGTGGHFIAVRDGRNVDGGNVGGANFEYVLSVVAQNAATEAVPLSFGTTLSGALKRPGGVDLWAFDGTEGMDVRFDFATGGDLDGRLFVFATTEGSWIARQDNRSAGDPNPLLDAPLFASGPMYLVVENIAEEATSLGYTVDASTP